MPVQPDPQKLLAYLLNTCGLFTFPIHSINTSGTCTCRKGKDCTAPGKHPYLNLKWKEIATNSMTRLASWTKKREVNYAICTGRKSAISGKHLIVVDVDKADHEIIQTLPKTFSYKTGSGGFHFWFWSVAPIKNSVSQLADKVDIRGTGGYVIIPPSKHISGLNYELLCDPEQPIADLPLDIIETLSKISHDNSVLSKGKRRTSTKIPKGGDGQATENPIALVALKWWSKTPIPAIRTSLASGTKIPMGVRNIVLHRLLSSDRARGAAAYDDLFTRGLDYRAQMENSNTFEDCELRNIVCSVMRYPVYNNEVENVNKNYAKWMSRFAVQKVDLKTLDSMDEAFFSRLQPATNGGVSLISLAQTRKDWYSSNGMKEGFATYRSQLLAKKLETLGFKRTRSAKRNVWNVDISQVFEVQNMAPADYPTTRKLNMSDEKNTENTEVVETPVAEGDAEGFVEETEEESGPASGKMGPDGKPLTLIEEREEVIKAKAKYHPNDEKYVGRMSSQEQMSALIKFYAELSSEQEKAYEEGVLLYDEERTRDWLGFLQAEDIIGLKGQMYKVLETSDDALVCAPRGYDKYNRKAHFDTDPETFTIYDVDMALNLALGEILYRNDQPFGVEQEMSYKVKVSVYADSIGRTYVFKSGRKVIAPNASETDSKQEPEEKK